LLWLRDTDLQHRQPVQDRDIEELLIDPADL